MSISTTESFQSVRMLDAINAEDAEEANRRARVEMLTAEFLKAAADCQADKVALFARRVRDHNRGGMRFQTVGDVLRDEIESRAFGDRAVEVLLNAAAGRGTQREAQQLLAEMAAHWADTEADA